MYECDICEKKFATAYTMKRHRDKMHPALRDVLEGKDDDNESRNEDEESNDDNDDARHSASDEEADMEVDERSTADHWTHYANLVKKLFEEDIQSEDIRENDLQKQRLVRELNEAFLLQYQLDLVRYEALKNDETTESVLKTRKRFMRDEEMLSLESLKAAIERRKHLILEHAPEDWFEDEEEEEEEEQVLGSATMASDVHV